MQIIEKFAARQADPYQNPIPKLAFLGDSVTHGCFELVVDDKFRFQPRFDRAAAYHALLEKMLGVLYPSVPVSIINAGFNGNGAVHALKRLEQDVLSQHPDLTVVCLGLNDCHNGEEGIEVYHRQLKQIFNALLAQGSEVIYMTPNMMNTAVVPPDQGDEAKNRFLRESAAITMHIQNSGRFDRYIAAGRQAAAECGVAVCDVYAKWKTLAAGGVDINALLSNGINHPTTQLHQLFAWSLLETMFA